MSPKEAGMADENTICALVGSEVVPPGMEAIWDRILDAAEAVEAALAAPADDDAVVGCRRELRTAVLALCAEPTTGGDEVRRKIASLHLLDDLDDPYAPLGVAMATLAVRADLARLGLVVEQLMDDGALH